MGRGAEGVGPEARSGAPAGPHASHLFRRARHPQRQRRHRAAVRSPGQAAGILGLARGPGPVDTQVRRRQAVWPRRRG
ncbi:hypothetical protein G6F61_014427 [Rhizopus arrhizus]|nr:hypothetical protein G6F32_017083 [Rhizopus arrhizus]KAG1360379.1 hypothetical protein G6F61_014427 [Rhizopus arrhizus]